jgi:hypothetical protein
MPRVIVGFGECRGYRVTEVPSELLNQLAERYPLVLQEESQPDHEDLIITIAVHSEIRRRVAGEQQVRHVPSLRELAHDIVNRGYPQASKLHHPDGKGHHEAQLRLTRAKEELLTFCATLADEIDEYGAVMIPDSLPPRSRSARPPSAAVSDDDVPF